MRVGLVSDIHANPISLDAVVTALAKADVDRVICLGDVTSHGPDPRGALARIRELRWPVIMGNMDAWALDPQPHPIRNEDTPHINAIELWSAARLDATDRAAIRGFLPKLSLALSRDQSLLAYHGSPRSYYEAIQCDTPDQQLAMIFAGESATVLAGGHTHTQMVRRWTDRLIVNPGSVGAPYELRRGATTVRYPPWAEFAIVSATGGELSVELRRTPVDVEAILVLAAAMSMPEFAWWSARWQR
jgi:predicted phosphodiesterase